MTEAVAKTRILLADDHTLFRHGLKTLLSAQPDFQVVGEACNGDEALKLAVQLQPDILLLDISMPVISGIEVLRSLFELGSDVRTIVLSVALNAEEIPSFLKLGARGFVPKESASTILFSSIRAVMTGQFWIESQGLSGPDQMLMRHGHHAEVKKSSNFGLTERELQIVKAVVSGRSNHEIADFLSISEHTVKHHITSIFDKLGVFNRLELALFVYHHDILEKGQR